MFIGRIKTSNMSRKIALLGLLLLFALAICKADSWGEPKEKKYYSDNMKYKLIVTPRFIPKKYYEWEYKKEPIANNRKESDHKENKLNKRFTAKDTVQVPCHAKLYRMSDTDTILIWERNLLNYMCPLHAIISNDGSSIVTIDNWYSCGYGETTMVVYNEKGDAKRNYQLSDISPYPLNDYELSISSIWWYAGATFIDKDRVEIVFHTHNKTSTKRIYNTKLYEFEKMAFPEF